jgi:ribonuclease HIII
VVFLLSAGRSFTDKTVTSHTATVTPEQAARLEKILRERGYVPREVPYARFSGVKPDHNVTCYQSGKVVIQGKGTREFVEFVLEPEVLQTAAMGYEEVLTPELFDPRLGVDESGKGDFFGPLCVAGVYVNAEIIREWKSSGIRDSKNIGSDRQIATLAELIRETPGCVVSVVPIGCEAYNRMHRTSGSVNSILAWGHARVIENLMLQKDRMIPPPIRAISDQFARDTKTVARALMEQGRQIELVQRHKAESDVAVAAASILARHEFVTRLKALEKEMGHALPRGASAAVETAGRELVAARGPEVLPRVAKMHFRTRYRVLGEPEPPPNPWKPSGSGKSSKAKPESGD